MPGRRFDPGKILPLFFPVFLILCFPTYAATNTKAKGARPILNAENSERGQTPSGYSPAGLVPVTDRMKSLAKSLDHMPDPPGLGTIQIPMIDLKRSPAKKKEENR